MSTALTDRPTICHVLHTLSVGGAEVLAAEYARHSQPDYRVAFACLDGIGPLGETLRGEGFPLEVLGRRSGFDLGCSRRLRQFLRRENVALVHAHQYAPFFYTALSRWPWGGVPILFMEHGRDYPDYPRPKRKFANRFLLRRCDRVVAVGECVRQALIDNEGLPAERIEVVYNGVDVRRYDPQRRERDVVRRELGLAADATVIMQVARLNRLKDHGTALRAMAQVAAQDPQARLVLVGDGEERPAIEQLIAELSLGSQVLILGTRRDVPRVLQAADQFLLSSITEGIALTLIEAMATGLPIVATQVGGNGEVVVDGETGYLTPAGDATKMAERILRLARNDAQARQFGMAGQRRAFERFDDRAMHASYQRIYGEMLRRPAAATRSGAAVDQGSVTS